MIQPRLYLWGVILVEQAMITIKWKLIEKKELKPLKTLLLSKVRKQNKNFKKLHMAYKKG